MNHRETGSFTPSIKYHRAVPRIPAVLLKVYLKGLDSPKALRADIVFEPRKRESETERERESSLEPNKAHPAGSFIYSARLVR